MKNILLTLMVFGSFELVGSNLSAEDSRYINSMSYDLFVSQDKKKYNNFPKYKAVSIGIKNRKLDLNYVTRTGKAGSQAEANSYSLAKCETRTGLDCILFMEGQANVLKKNLTSYLSGNLIGFIPQQINLCRKYGFEGSSLANCAKENVEKIINDFETYVAPQQNQTRQRNYNWGALSDLGKDLSESFGGRSLQPRTKICNFKSFEGAIISGDCSQTAINSGGTTYWKLN
jgi:hypothetical protein